MSESDSRGSAANEPVGSDPSAPAAASGRSSSADIAALRRREAEQRLLVSLYDAMREFADPALLQQRIVERVGRHYGVSRCAYAEFDPQQSYATVRCDYVDGVRSMAGTYALADFDTSLVDGARRGQTIVVEDVESDPRVRQSTALAVFRSIETRAFIIVPLIQDGRLATLLSLQHRQPRRWTPGEVGLAMEIAERTRLAVDTLRSRAELEENREVLNLALRSGRMGAWSFIPAAGKMWISPEVETLLGIPPGGFDGSLRAFYEMLHPDDTLQVQRSVQRMLLVPGDHAAEYRCRHADGSYRWIEARGRSFLGADGHAQSCYGVILDISERRLSEEAQRSSDELLRVALNSTAVAFVILRAVRGGPQHRILDFGFVYVNEAAAAILGKPSDELLSRCVEEVLPGQWDHGTSFEACRRVTETRRAEYLETPSDLQLVRGWLELRITPYGDGVAIWFDDISSRKQSEEALRRQATLFAMQGDAAVFIDPEGRIVDMNPAFESLFGYRRDELLGRSHTILHEEQDAATITAEMFRELHRRGEWRREIVYVRKDGRRGTCESLVRPIWDRGRIVGAVGISRDITERKLAEAEMRVANARKDQFLATLAHELRNPLAPMRNAVELLRRRGGLDPDLAQLRDIFGRQLGHLTRLVEDLLDASRISRGVVELKLVPVLVNDAILGAVETVNPALLAAGHALELQLPPAPLQVRADPTRLTQVFVNLLANAIRYTPANGHIAVETGNSGGQLRVIVRDNGIGIPADKLHGVFDMFSQIAPADARSQGGLGIGLALVRGLLELHGGTVRAESRGPGLGSEFIVELPLLDQTATAEQAAPANLLPQATAPSVPAPLAAKALRILVADDNVDAAESLAMVLRLEGHEPSVAFDGADAIAAAEALRPHAAIIDLGMPRVDGFAVARHIRSQAWGREMRLIALSGWGMRADQQRALEAGFSVHLTKPAQWQDIQQNLPPGTTRS